MKIVGDLHIHSKFSRATSPKTDLENLTKWARIKGIKVVGTGDFTHPQWLKELKDKLIPAEEGLFRLNSDLEPELPAKISNKKGEFTDFDTRFLLTSEINCIYSKHTSSVGRNLQKKIHLVILAPDFNTVDKINAQFSKINNLEVDGRPVLNIDSEKVAEIVFNISSEALIIPAHCMTPWFGIFGSKSGFNSLQECFGSYSKYIYALETGLSADPEMIWRIPEGQEMTIISNSDAHSPQKLGREANIFEGNSLNYYEISQAIKNGGKNSGNLKLTSTVEFFPEEGKYHHDGHRFCKVNLSPKETQAKEGICPNCGKPLTVGVLSRIEELANKEEGFKPKGAIPFRKIIPLAEIIAKALDKTVSSKTVENEYYKLINLGSEFDILLSIPSEEISRVSESVAKMIEKMRKGKVKVEPGFDGEYGKINFSGEQENSKNGQKKLL